MKILQCISLHIKSSITQISHDNTFNKMAVNNTRICGIKNEKLLLTCYQLKIIRRVLSYMNTNI